MLLIMFMCNVIDGSIVNGSREPILHNLGLSSLIGHKISKELKIELIKKIIKSVLSHITFYLKDDDHKPLILLVKRKVLLVN